VISVYIKLTETPQFEVLSPKARPTTNVWIVESIWHNMLPIIPLKEDWVFLIQGDLTHATVG
jgi:hypothetical protein